MNTIRCSTLLMMMALCGSVLANTGTVTNAPAEPLTTLNEFLQSGRFSDGVRHFSTPNSNEERFSLAFLQVFDAVQQFTVEFNQVSINPEIVQFSGLNLPSSGTSVSAVQVARMFTELKASLKQANLVLSQMDDKPFSVPVDFAKVRFDINGNGLFTPGEMLLAPLGELRSDEEIWIHFDSADAAWLQGYTHVVPGLLEILTSYDWMPVWNQCAHHLFHNPQPMPPIARYSSNRHLGSTGQIADLIAALHELRLEVVDPDGLRRARDDFQGMVRCSRICWKRILAETDDDHEWLPSPNQTGPGGALTTQVQIDAWHEVLDELEAVLGGKKGLAHWRIKEGTGINLDKLVNNPPELDLVLLAQGSAFIPYLEEGPTSDLDTWSTLIEPFGRGFAMFALWSN